MRPFLSLAKAGHLNVDGRCICILQPKRVLEPNYLLHLVSLQILIAWGQNACKIPAEHNRTPYDQNSNL